MNFKSLSNGITRRVGRQVLTARKHSPIMLMTVGVVGMASTVVLACRATLKLSDVLEEADDKLKTVEVAVTEGGEDDGAKHSFNVRLGTAITVAKLYAPAAIVGTVSLVTITGSYVILQRRNVGLAAAYAVVDKSFKTYRARVVADQGEEKDHEYRFGKYSREIVEEGPNGPEVRTIEGPDAEKINEEASYARVFGPTLPNGEPNPNWSDLPNENQYFIQMVQSQANDALTTRGYFFLSDVYDLLGFEPTAASRVVGWVSDPKIDEVTGKPSGDGFISFGVWQEGVENGKEWVRGDKRSISLDFNVDGPILHNLDRM